MTESELVEAITSYFDIAVAALTLYVTICSGYLIVAYMVGGNLILKRLSFQLSIVSSRQLQLTPFVHGHYAVLSIWPFKSLQN